MNEETSAAPKSTLEAVDNDREAGRVRLRLEDEAEPLILIRQCLKKKLSARREPLWDKTIKTTEGDKNLKEFATELKNR